MSYQALEVLSTTSFSQSYRYIKVILIIIYIYHSNPYKYKWLIGIIIYDKSSGLCCGVRWVHKLFKLDEFYVAFIRRVTLS
jgi:hypothetical protein